MGVCGMGLSAIGTVETQGFACGCTAVLFSDSGAALWDACDDHAGLTTAAR